MTATRLGAVLLLWAAAELPAAGSGPPPSAIQPEPSWLSSIHTYPLIPTDSVPTRLTLVTELNFVTGAEPLVLREGNVLKVIVGYVYYRCDLLWPCPDEGPRRTMTVDLGILEPGSYTLEVYHGGPAPASRRERLSLAVIPGPSIALSPEKPWTGDDILVAVVFGPGACPHLGAAQVAGSRITLPVSLGDCAAVATSAALPPLPAGVYQVELTVDQQVYARSELVVADPRPILRDGRFEVAVSYRTATGASGPARLVQPPSADSALFYFFGRDNWELMVKVLDGCGINGRYWVFAAASTDVEFHGIVKDLATGGSFEFDNPLGRPAGAINDIDAFPCD